MSKVLDPENDDTAIEIWKIRKLIRSLENARGNGTSMVSLIVPPRDQVSRLSTMLTSEMGTAVNIKSRVNRASVLSAITSVQQRLKLFTKIPDNGLAIYSGEVIGPDGKEKKVSIDITPFKPIASFLYRCDSCFHTGPLKELLEDDQKFGFIVLDGSGCLFGCVTGGTRTVLQKFTVDLPKKHGRGGQSALRFARLRLEKRHNYLRKVAETAVSVFISGDRPNIAGLVLAGSAEFKNQLSQSEMFDPRLVSIITTIVDVSYGGENGFNQAIELASDSLANVKFVKEKRLLSKYFNEIARDTGKYCYGIKDVMSALEMSAVESIICWEGITANRYELRNSGTGEISYAILDEKQATDHENFKGPDGNELEVVSIEPLVDWLSNNYKSFGTTLHFVTNKSQEGSQFVRGFGGIGALMRYKLDLDTVEFEEIDEDGFI